MNTVQNTMTPHARPNLWLGLGLFLGFAIMAFLATPGGDSKPRPRRKGTSFPPVPQWTGAKAEPTKEVMVYLDGEPTILNVQVYSVPAPIISPLLASREQATLLTPEDAHRAQLSADTPEWVLSCFDNPAQEHLAAIDKKQHGKFLGTTQRSRAWPPQHPYEYLYRAFWNHDNNNYCFLRLQQSHDKTPAVLTFIQQKDSWLRTFTLDNSPLIGILTNLDTKSISALDGKTITPIPVSAQAQPDLDEPEEKQTIVKGPQAHDDF